MEQLIQFAINNSIAAALLAIIVWLVTRLWRNPHVAHVLWGLVFLKLICPNVVSLPIPVVTLPAMTGPAMTGRVSNTSTSDMATPPELKPATFTADPLHSDPPLIDSNRFEIPTAEIPTAETPKVETAFVETATIADDSITSNTTNSDETPLIAAVPAHTILHAPLPIEETTLSEVSPAISDTAIPAPSMPDSAIADTAIADSAVPTAELDATELSKAALPLVSNVGTESSDTINGSGRDTFQTAFATTSSTANVVTTSRFNIPWQPLLLVLSLAGSIVWATVVVRRLAKFRHCLQLAPCVEADVLSDARDIATQLGLHHLPQIRWIDGPLPPLLWFSGRRLSILLPRELWKNISPEKRQLVLAHELIHVQRRDYLCRWLETLIIGLYWWNPVVWLARRYFHTAEDACCDQRTLALFPARVADYGNLLIDSAQFISRTELPLVTFAGGVGHPHTLKTRVKTMLANTKRPPLRWPTRIVLALGCCALLSISLELRSEINSLAIEFDPTTLEEAKVARRNQLKARTPLRDNNPTAGNYIATSELDMFVETPVDVEVTLNEPANFDPFATTGDDNDAPQTDFRDDFSPVDSQTNGVAPHTQSAREKAQAALISAIADPDPQVSEQAMKTIQRLGLISKNPKDKTLTPQLKAVMAQILQNPDTPPKKRLQAAVMLIPSGEHQHLVLQALLDCFINRGDEADAITARQHLGNLLSSLPTPVIAQSCQDLSMQSNLTKLCQSLNVEKISGDFELQLVLRKKQERRFDANSDTFRSARWLSTFSTREGAKVPGPAGIGYPILPLDQLSLNLWIAFTFADNSDIAATTLLEEFEKELTLSGTVSGKQDGPPPKLRMVTEQIVRTTDDGREVGEEVVRVVSENGTDSRGVPFTTDDLAQVLKLMRPESEAVLEVYIKQMASGNPKIRQLATVVIGNALAPYRTDDPSVFARHHSGSGIRGDDDDEEQRNLHSALLASRRYEQIKAIKSTLDGMLATNGFLIRQTPNDSFERGTSSSAPYGDRGIQPYQQNSEGVSPSVLTPEQRKLLKRRRGSDDDEENGFRRATPAPYRSEDGFNERRSDDDDSRKPTPAPDRSEEAPALELPAEERPVEEVPAEESKPKQEPEPASDDTSEDNGAE